MRQLISPFAYKTGEMLVSVLVGTSKLLSCILLILSEFTIRAFNAQKIETNLQLRELGIRFVPNLRKLRICSRKKGKQKNKKTTKDAVAFFDWICEVTSTWPPTSHQIHSSSQICNVAFPSYLTLFLLSCAWYGPESWLADCVELQCCIN